MKFFFRTQVQRKLVLNVCIILISLIGIIKREQLSEDGSLFEQIMMDSIAPVQSGLVFIKNFTEDLVQNYLLIVNAQKENGLLKGRVMRLEGQLAGLEEVKRENIRLKKLLRFGGDLHQKKVLAQIVAIDSASEFKVIRINKGSADGIERKLSVVTSKGLVGHVYRVSKYYSDILTIIDQKNRVDALMSTTRTHGVVEGLSKDHIVMKYVTRTARVIKGDRVISSGLGNIYPKGLEIGHVSEIEKVNYGITQFIKIRPSVDFDRLEEVIVLMSDSDPDLVNVNRSTLEAE